MLRVEENGSELRLIKPGVDRVTERLGWSLGAGVLGLCGAFALAGAWQQVTEVGPSIVWGASLLLIGACMLWKAARLQDVVWIVRADPEKRTLERAGRVVARFDEVRCVRCRVLPTRSGQQHEITVVVNRGRTYRDVILCSTTTPFPSAAERVAFEQAAARIADAIGTRVEHR
jgi:hypothetical protein